MAVYATTDELRIRIQQLSTPSADQLVMMNEIIEAASRNVDRMCRKPDGFVADPVAEERYFTSFGEKYLRIPSCVSVSLVAAKASTSATTYIDWVSPTAPNAGDGDWIPCRGDEHNPVFGQPPYDLLVVDANGDYSYFLEGDGRPVIKITAKWSSQSEIPADIREATLMQAAIWMKQYQGGMSNELGTVNYGRITYRRELSQGVKQILVDGGWVVPLYGSA